ncbi:BON domain-containing protein [Lysobacter sp. BMK333-48F3]|uniref:BON domain-containing protein n=1 Tax=Lysobacter sp. BMK333-48F3 TaxID=2867962 RepID=UPI001C8C8BE3|nr:BON domain-containing protein [Lysobacter sp. BMK333-48F3]MBX9403167.1 BON domain-containing protein [Lysobacter sp. BMK333-48F3]
MKAIRTASFLLGLSLCAAAVAAPQSAGTAAAQDPATTAAGNESAQPVSDTWITTKVKTELLATKGVSGTDISVETVNGVVKLSGHVAGKAESDKAAAVARNVDGVKSVDTSALVAAKSGK